MAGGSQSPQVHYCRIPPTHIIEKTNLQGKSSVGGREAGQRAGVTTDDGKREIWGVMELFSMLVVWPQDRLYVK